MYNLFTRNIRKVILLTSVSLSISITINVYISFLLWCQNGSTNCYSEFVWVTSTSKGAIESNSGINGINSSVNRINGNAIRSRSITFAGNNSLASQQFALRKWLQSNVMYHDNYNTVVSLQTPHQNQSTAASTNVSSSSSKLNKSSSRLESKLTINLINDYHSKTVEHRRRFNCPALINGSRVEIQKVLDYHETHRPANGFPATDPSMARRMLQDCPAFQKIRGYHTDSTTIPEEEASYPIAYVILAHRDFDHLERLLHTLYRPQHVFCIHLDQKVKDDLKQAVSALASCFPNVVLASKPEKIIYAHMSRLMADIVCMRDLLKSKVPWRYLINTAATGFPLRTNGEMVQVLKILNGKNDIHEVFAARRPLRWEVEYHVTNGKIKATNKPMPPPPHNLTVVKGQAYNTYSREFLHWAMRDRRAKDLLRWSAKTYSPDEHYWATLNNLYHNPFLNSPGGFKGDPDQKGYITMVAVWATNKNQRHTCQGRNVHNICLFGVGDLNFLSTKMFLTCNKLDLGFDPVAYSCMEEWLESRTLNSDLVKFDSNFYKRLRFIWYNNDKDKLDKGATTGKQKKTIKKERKRSGKGRDRDREKKKDKAKEQESDKELEMGDNEKYSDREETKNRKVIKKRKEEMRINGRRKDGKKSEKNEDDLH